MPCAGSQTEEAPKRLQWQYADSVGHPFPSQVLQPASRSSCGSSGERNFHRFGLDRPAVYVVHVSHHGHKVYMARSMRRTWRRDAPESGRLSILAFTAMPRSLHATSQLIPCSCVSRLTGARR